VQALVAVALHGPGGSFLVIVVSITRLRRKFCSFLKVLSRIEFGAMSRTSPVSPPIPSRRHP